MKKIFLLVILLCASRAWGQDVGLTGAPPTAAGGQGLSLPARGADAPGADVVSSRRIFPKEMAPIRDDWEAWRKAHAAGDEKSAHEALERLNQDRLNLGLRNLFLYSSALVREGKARAHAGHVREGLDLIDSAIELSRGFPPAYFAGLSVSLANFDAAGAMAYGLKGIQAAPANFFYTLSLLGNTFFFLLGSLFAALIVYAGVLVLRYSTLFSHDVGDLFPGRPPRFATLALGLLILFLPLLLDAGPIWLMAWILMLTYPYGTRGEKAITMVFFLLLVASPVIIRAASSFLTADPSGPVTELARERGGDWDEGLMDSLKARAKETPGDSGILMGLGLMAKKTGDLRSAVDFYGTALGYSDRKGGPAPAAVSSAGDPRLQARLHVDLGNALAGLEDQEGAVKEYKKAIDLYPDLASAHYNLGQLYLKKGRIEGEEELRKAKDLDPDQSAYYTEIFSPVLNRLYIDEELPVDDLISRFLAPAPEKTRVIDGFLHGFMKGVDTARIPFVGIGLSLVSLLLWALLTRLGAAVACERCGKPSCRRCLGVADSRLCTQCHAIFVKREGVDPNVRIKKEGEIRRGEDRRLYLTRICAFLIPGSGHMLRGAAVPGVVVAAVFVMGAMKLALWEGFIRYRYPIEASFPAVQVGCLSLFLLVWYLAALASFLRGE